jgi:hypothetical protein
VNSQETIEAIGEVLERYYRGHFTAYEALTEIARIKEEAKGQQQ